MKAVLRYVNCLQDGRTVFYILSTMNVEILKTKHNTSTYPKVVIRINSYNELNKLLSVLNHNCIYDVTLVKVITENNLLNRLKKIIWKE